MEWIARSIARRVGSRVPVELFRRWLGAYPWFLVLDGLDEVPAGAARDRLMRCIEDFWVDAAHERADVFVLATTRPQGYNNDFSRERYEHKRLVDMSPERALQYGSRLAFARYGDGDRTETVVERLQRAIHNDTTLHLMRSPLQVAIMTALVDRFGLPPHERWSLFHRYYEVIYQRERERDTDAAPILSEYQPDIDAIHQRVGLALQVLTTRDGRSDPFLTAHELTRIVNGRLSEEGHQREATASLAERIRAAAELRLVFLVGAQEDRIGFEIRSLQEFMAAGALVDGPDAQVIARLRAIAPLPHWRNVLLFAVGECFVRKQWLRAPLQNLCRSLDVEADDPLLGPMQVGARLVVDLLGDHVARHQPGPRRVFVGHALEALDIADPDLSMGLARCYDDGLADLYRDKLGDLLGTGDEIRRTNARRCLAALGAAGAAWAGEMLAASPPPGAAEALAMLHELPMEVFDGLDAAYAAACVSQLDHWGLTSLARGGCLAGLLPELRWLEVAARRSAVRVELGDGVGLAFTGMAAAVEPRGFRWSAAQAGQVGPSPTLVVYRAAEAFARQPDIDGLAQAITSVAAESTAEVWAICAFDVPWPLGAILARANSPQELQRAIDDVRAGRHGDHDAWEDAERRWKNDGVDLLDAIEAAPPFPLEVTRLKSYGVDRGMPLPLLDEFRTLHRAGHPAAPNLARHLVSIIAHGEDGPSLGSEDVRELFDVVTEVDVNVLGALRASARDVSEVLAAMPAHARFTLGVRGSVAPSTVSRLMTEASVSGSPRAIEALAFAVAGCAEPPAGSLRLSSDQEDPVTRACAGFLSLMLGDPTIPARELGRLLATTDNPRPHALLASEHTLGCADSEEILAGYRASVPRRWFHQRRTDRLMNRLLSQRPAPLADRAVWDDLGLFDPHPVVLTRAPRGPVR